MSKRSNSLRGEMHDYQKEYEAVHGKQDWIKRTVDNIAVIRAELGESWFQRWKLNKNNHGEAKRLGL